MPPLYDPDSETKFPIWVDASFLSAFKECERKGLYRGLLDLRPGEINPHFNAGGAYAKAHEVTRNLIYGEERLDTETAVAFGLSTLIREYGDYEPPADGRPSVQAKTWLGVADAFIRHYRRWPPEIDWLMPDMVERVVGDSVVLVPSHEFSFAVPIGDFIHPETGDPLLYAGRSDMRVRVGPTGVWTRYQHGEEDLKDLPLYVYDDKTTHQMGKTWASQWTFRSQFIGYVWADNQVSPEDKTVGAVVSGAGIQKTQTKTERTIVEIPQWKIDDWYDSTCETIKRLYQCFESGTWTKAWDSACTAYGGCDFQDVCNARYPNPWLRQFYVGNWNPIEQKEED